MAENYSPYGTPIPPVEPRRQRALENRTLRIILIAVVILIVLCVCCLAFALILYFWLGDIITDALGITSRLIPTLGMVL